MLLCNIEIIIGLLMLFMGVPDLCRKLGRPGLGYPVFVLIGLSIAPLVSGGVQTMLVWKRAKSALSCCCLRWVWKSVCRIRVILLRPLRLAGLFVLLQYPLILMAGRVVGLGWLESLIAAAALTSCSVGMAHAA